MKHVRKWLPVPTYDLPGMEGWLEEMAGKGLYLERLKSWTARFRRGEPRPRRFRLQPCCGREREFLLQKPPEDLMELFSSFGWQCEGWASSSLVLFSTDDPEAPEPNPDPQTLELALEPLFRTAVRNLRLEVSFGIFVLFLCILELPCFMPRIWENGIPALFICFIPLALLNLWDAKRSNQVLQDLRRRLQEGDPLPPRPGPFSPRQTILRLTLQLLLVAVLLWRFCLDILAV